VRKLEKGEKGLTSRELDKVKKNVFWTRASGRTKKRASRKEKEVSLSFRCLQSLNPKQHGRELQDTADLRKGGGGGGGGGRGGEDKRRKPEGYADKGANDLLPNERHVLRDIRKSPQR